MPFQAMSNTNFATIKRGNHTVAVVYAGSKAPRMERVSINAHAICEGLKLQENKLREELEDVKIMLSRLPDKADSPEAAQLCERYAEIKTYLNGF